MKIIEKEIQIIVKIIRNAIRITEWFKKEGFKTYIKQDQSPVTLADYASQIYLISNLKELYPKNSVIAEETFSSELNNYTEKMIQSCYNKLNLSLKPNIKEILNYRGPNSKIRWSIDPIDGTKGYQKGLSYAIGIGMISNQEKKLSIIGVPNYNKEGVAIFIAKKGEGALASYGGKEYVPIKVSETRDVKKSLLCHSLHYDEPWVMKLANKLGIEKYIQIDSMAKFCMVADSSADVYIKPMSMDRSFIWDFLPGDLLVMEAGGKVTDLKGRFPKYIENKCVISSPGLIASNGNFHQEILDFIESTPNLLD
jgi:3'-phosphoadenosine 5'-phosphosulfate (PAPS) 3'-phosphatase